MMSSRAVHDHKIRRILNKADQIEIDRQQLMRVYGALLRSFGKTIPSPEVALVYVGSPWEKPLSTSSMDNADLFEMEERDLMQDLAVLPRLSTVRKINELVKRIREVKTLACIIGHLKAQMQHCRRSPRFVAVLHDMSSCSSNARVSQDSDYGGQV